MKLVAFVELQITLDALLVVLFSLTLVKVCRGSSLRIVIWLIILLIISNASAVIVELLIVGTFVNPTHTSPIVADVALATSYFIQMSTFSVAHWILAAKYRMNAAEMPLIVQGKQVPEEQRESRRRNFRLVLALNILATFAELLFDIPLNIALFSTTTESPSAFVLYGAIITPTVMTVFLVVSGVVLIRSILKIRNFYRDSGTESQLNTRALLFHAVAFGLYMIGVVLYAIAWDISTRFPTNEKLVAIMMVVYTVQIVISAVA